MEYQDKKMYCCDCNVEFLWTAGAQSFMQGLKDDGKLDRTDPYTGGIIIGQVTPPKRCEDCRTMKKSRYSKG